MGCVLSEWLRFPLTACVGTTVRSEGENWGRFWGKMAFGARFGAIKYPYLSAIVQIQVSKVGGKMNVWS